MSANDKDTVYIDIDDEITTVIEKVASSKERIVALVLPKRAAVMQSIVNMKLLKRAADTHKKRLVLITNETALLPLAGAAGIHVAKNLQSRPMIPINGLNDDDTIDADESTQLGDPADDDFNADAAAGTSIGELAGGATAATETAKPLSSQEDLETIELDNDDAVAAAPVAAVKADKPKKPKKDKKLAVPNFNKFRLLLILGVLAIVILGVLLYVCTAILPKASVTISTDTSDIPVSATLTLDTKASETDSDEGVVPAGMQQKQQSSSQQVPSTGQQNNGQKASGTITLSAGACSGDAPDDVPAGTGVSTNGLTFITQDDASFIPVLSGKKCTYQSSGGIDIAAQKAGASYNVPQSSSLAVAGRSDVTAKLNNATSGGTDNIVKVVAQTDIDAAKAKLAAADSNTAKQALSDQLSQAGYKSIDATFAAGTPTISPSASVGTASDTVTVTQVITYSMYGIKENDIKSFVRAKITKQIDPTKQSILDYGVNKAAYKLTSTTPEQVALQTTAVAGPDIKPETIKQQVAGKKSGAIKSDLKQNPGVSDVNVKLSPFWVTSVPKKDSKITVTFVKSTDDGKNP